MQTEHGASLWWECQVPLSLLPLQAYVCHEPTLSAHTAFGMGRQSCDPVRHSSHRLADPMTPLGAFLDMTRSSAWTTNPRDSDDDQQVPVRASAPAPAASSSPVVPIATEALDFHVPQMPARIVDTSHKTAGFAAPLDPQTKPTTDHHGGKSKVPPLDMPFWHQGTLKELQRLCKSYGLSTRGKKKELIERLRPMVLSPAESGSS